MLPESELQRRKPLWSAIATLWLDTEISAAEIEQIASAAIHSRYSTRELNEIYLYEVAPVVHMNLLGTAGVWSGFDDEWLHAEAHKRAVKRGMLLRVWVRTWIGRRMMTYATDEYWREVIRRVNTNSDETRV